MKILKPLPFILVISLITSSCSLTKRRYMPGFYLEKKSGLIVNSNKQITSHYPRMLCEIPLRYSTINARIEKSIKNISINYTFVKCIAKASKGITKLNKQKDKILTVIHKSSNTNTDVSPEQNPAHGWVIAAFIFINGGIVLFVIGFGLLSLTWWIRGILSIIVGLTCLLIAGIVNAIYRYDEAHPEEKK